MSPGNRERGSAIVEFHFLGLLLLVPLVYVLLTVLDVQRTAFGVTQAAREAGRVFVATGDEAAARLAAEVALADQGVDAGAAEVAVRCSGAPCYQPGGEITVRVRSEVSLPFLPPMIADAVHARIPVDATHAAVIDRFRAL
ncbi:MAG: pilus assembly protein [Jiangellaceae bacterium]|nr:pilus assembly protein [Jiangellaceae bacterium]